MKGTYTPDPKSVNRLEWELESVMRRQAHVDGVSGAMRLACSRWGAGLAMALLSMFMGAAGTHAAMNGIEGREA